MRRDGTVPAFDARSVPSYQDDVDDMRRRADDMVAKADQEPDTERRYWLLRAADEFDGIAVRLDEIGQRRQLQALYKQMRGD